jgi:hypothetical protein
VYHEHDLKNSKLAIYRADKTLSVDTIAGAGAIVQIYAFMFELRVAGIQKIRTD